MRKVILKMSVSIDGFVGGPKGDIDWIFRSLDDEATAWILDTLWQAGVHVMGNNTYRDMTAHWPTSAEKFAPPMNQIPKVVFSKSRRTAEWTDSEILSGDLVDEITRLKDQPGGDILAHGGARFAQSLSRLGLVDEYRLVTHPVVLGAGLPLFPELSKPVDLKLLGVTTFPAGAVAHVYGRA